jgi:hypothetical protein
MDITTTSEVRFALGIERFLARESLAYRGVVFYKDAEHALQISSYSDWTPERCTEAQARDKIEVAKSVLLDLAARSPQFNAIATRLRHEHYFCYDYGNGSLALAKESGGKFEWLYLPSAKAP